jgi:hypothetical protein
VIKSNVKVPWRELSETPALAIDRLVAAKRLDDARCVAQALNLSKLVDIIAKRQVRNSFVVLCLRMTFLSTNNRYFFTW